MPQLASEFILYDATINVQVNQLVLDTDPSAGPGVFATEGSIAQVNNGGTGELYLKTGPLNTDWAQITAGVNIYNADGVQTSGTRSYDMDGNDLEFINGATFTVDATIIASQYPPTRDDTATFGPQNLLYNGPSGELFSFPISGLAAVLPNIYTNNGILTGPRVLDGAANSLTFNNLDSFQVQGNGTNNIVLDAGLGGDVQLLGTIINHSNYTFVTFDNHPNTRDDTATFAPTSYFYPGPAGELYVAPLASLPGGNNIYNSNGVVTGTRTVDGNNQILTFDNNFRFIANANQILQLFGGQTTITATSGMQLTTTGGGMNFSATQFVFNTGNLRLQQYPNTRDDTATFAPTSYFYPGPAGELYVAPLASLPGGNNIYNSDDTLTGNRTLLGGGNSLNLIGLNQFNVDGTGNVGIVGDGNVTLQSDNGIATLSGDTQTLVTSGGPLNIAATGSGPINMQTVSPQPINITPGGGGDLNLGNQVGFLDNQVRIRSQGASSDYNVIVGDKVQHLATDVDTGQLQPDAGNVKAIGHHSGTQNLRVDVTGLTDFMWFEVRAAGTFTAGIGGGSAIYRAHYNPFTGAVTVEESAANGDVSLAFAGAVAGSLAFTFTPVPAGAGMRKTLELHMYGTELADEINVNFSAV